MAPLDAQLLSPPGSGAASAAVSDALRTQHVEAVLEALKQRSPIYGTILPTLTLRSASCGRVVCRLVLDAMHVNSRGGLHGAVSATIVDMTTGMAIASWDLRDTTGASADMHLSYLGTAVAGDELEIAATAEKVGGSLAFVTIRIDKVGPDGERTPVTLAQHTKFVRSSSKNPSTGVNTPV
ncbi:Thioesterase superfamily [Cordyceps fumosorosea ARSEF 2679]|uniref:Thioesterase superfamily n=1 Tax=Cordyceps fumosorosea (strain ARSEF 2679) TaxID=1081104 RepID=A0A162I8C6_CORFA|nr:Thioesterase superfamily [Cordyceps fumosorosea ARSEF 2679]OAA53665.1 Thioesterase superfamily [Cordyceps fumosorosea ARSEF 2679]